MAAMGDILIIGANPVLLEFAGFGSGQIVAEGDEFGEFEGGQPFPQIVTDVLSERLAWFAALELDDGLHRFAEIGIGHAEHRCIQYGGMRRQRIFDFSRIERLLP